MAAGTAYSKRYAGGFADGSGGASPIDSVFLNAVETALLQLIAAAPGSDGQVMQWDNSNTRYGPALLLNKNVDAAAAIAKSKLDLTGVNSIVDADIAVAAAIARSKLNFGSGLVDADIAAAAAIAISKLAGSGDATKILFGDGTWAIPPFQKISFIPPPVAGQASSPANTAFETANAAILWPFTIQAAQTIAAIDIQVAGTQSGNFDVGIYNSAGTRMVSKGSTAQSTLSSSVANRVTIASTPLPAGQYYVALACDNATGSFRQLVSGDAMISNARKIATSFPLPASLTIGSTAPASLPVMSGPLT